MLAVALVGVIPPAAADAGHHKQRLRAHVGHKAVAHAPARWRAATGFRIGTAKSTPPTTVTPAATPAPAAAPATPATPVATPRPPALPGDSASSVSVASTEFAFALSQPAVGPGPVRIQFDNSRAQDPHDLVVRHGGSDIVRFGEAPPGAVTSRTVTLTPGTYTLLCPIGAHAALGMTADLTVTG